MRVKKGHRGRVRDTEFTHCRRASNRRTAPALPPPRRPEAEARRWEENQRQSHTKPLPMRFSIQQNALVRVRKRRPRGWARTPRNIPGTILRTSARLLSYEIDHCKLKLYLSLFVGAAVEVEGWCACMGRTSAVGHPVLLGCAWCLERYSRARVFIVDNKER